MVFKSRRLLYKEESIYLVPKRISRQIERADKLQRILWRLYSGFREHRKLIVKASYLTLQVVEVLEELLVLVKKDYKEEIKNPKMPKSTPPGYYKKDRSNEEKQRSL